MSEGEGKRMGYNEKKMVETEYLSTGAVTYDDELPPNRGHRLWVRSSIEVGGE